MNILDVKRDKVIQAKPPKRMKIRISYGGVITPNTELVKDLGATDCDEAWLVFFESEGSVYFREARNMDRSKSILLVKAYTVKDKRCKKGNQAYKRYAGKSMLLRNQIMDILFGDDPDGHRSKSGLIFLVEKDGNDYKIGDLV